MELNFYDCMDYIKTHTGILDLASGDPFIPKTLKKAILASIHTLNKDVLINVLSRYTQLDGIPSLKEKMLDLIFKEFGKSLSTDEILITPGANSALQYIQGTYLNPKSKVLFPLAYEYPGVFPAYPDGVILGSPNYFQDDDFSEEGYAFLETLPWDEIKLVILSVPNNPTGFVLNEKVLKYISQKLSLSSGFLILDKTYAFPLLPLTHKLIPFMAGGNIVEIYSFSKIGLASERVGIIFADKQIIRRLSQALRKNLIQSPKIGQFLALNLIKHLELPAVYYKEVSIQHYKNNWMHCKTAFENKTNLKNLCTIYSWGGGPFLFLTLNCSYSHEKIIFEALLKNKIAIMPGSCFLQKSSFHKNFIQFSPSFRLGLGIKADCFKQGVVFLTDFLENYFKTKFNYS